MKINKVSRRKWNSSRSLVYTKLVVRLNKRIKDDGYTIDMKKKIKLKLPCLCSKIQEDKSHILLTSADLDQESIRLGDADVILPYSEGIRLTVRESLNNCDNTEKKRFNLKLTYIQRFIERIKSY